MPNDTNNAPAQKAIVTEIKTPVIEPGTSFMANGKKYTVSGTFAIGRLETVNLLEEELSILGERADCHSIMKKALAHLDDSKPGLAYALMYNKLESDVKNIKLIHYTLRMCAAYINYEGEDIAYLTDEQIREKVNDWAVEGLNVAPFMSFAMDVYRKLFLNYNKDILNILEQVKTVKEALEEGAKSMDMEPSTEEEKHGNHR